MWQNQLSSPLVAGAAAQKKSRPNIRKKAAPIIGDGTRAVGTPLDTNNPAITKLNNGEAYDGDATVFGKTYDAGYEPIKDASGTVIGA